MITKEKVCKALSDFTNKKVIYDSGHKMFIYYEDGIKQTITDVIDINQLYIKVDIYLTIDLLELITEFYKGGDK
jgi:hypothetical protein